MNISFLSHKAHKYFIFPLNSQIKFFKLYF